MISITTQDVTVVTEMDSNTKQQFYLYEFNF